MITWGKAGRGLLGAALGAALVLGPPGAAWAEGLAISTDPVVEARLRTGADVHAAHGTVNHGEPGHAGAPGEAFGEPVTVTGHGVTRRHALREALRQAVEQRLGVQVTSRTAVADLAVASDRVTAAALGFIDGYTVTSAVRAADGEWTVTARVWVSGDPAEVDRPAHRGEPPGTGGELAVRQGLVRANLGDPRVVITAGDPWAAAELVNLVRAQGFSRVATGGAGDLRVSVHFADERVGRCTSPGFERDYTATVACHLSSPDASGEQAFITAEYASAWGTTPAQAARMARVQALRRASGQLAAWLRDHARRPVHHVRVVVNRSNPAEAQAWLEGTGLVDAVYVRGVSPGGCTRLDCDAAYARTELTTILLGMGVNAREADGQILVALPYE